MRFDVEACVIREAQPNRDLLEDTVMQRVFPIVFRLSLVSFAYLYVLSVTSSFAQEYPPIGRHYQNTIELVLFDDSGIAHNVEMAAIADINGDGLDDAVVLAMHSGPATDPNRKGHLSILTRNDAGLLVNSSDDLIEDSSQLMFYIGTLLIADFNGDGKLDIFVDSIGPELEDRLQIPGAQNSLLISSDDGKLHDVTTTHLPQRSDQSGGGCSADFDGDSDVDIYILSKGAREGVSDAPFPYLMFNDGEGRFSVVADFGVNLPLAIGPQGRLPEDFTYSGTWCSAVDAEGDGDVDIVLGHSTVIPICEEYSECYPWEARNVILINDGSGHFSEGEHPWSGHEPGTYPDYLGRSPWTHWGLVDDVNADGLDDLLRYLTVGPEWETTILQILISNGDGTFRDESEARYGPENLPSLSLYQLHDLDGDGHRDLFSTVNFENDDIRVNDGEGYFRRLNEDWVETEAQNWVVLDVDGDGGTDFVLEQWDSEMPSIHKFTLAKMDLPYGAELDGTSEDDRLIGGAHDNVYRGLAGNDVLDGGLGNDWLIGGKGNDTLIGGKGHDAYAWISSDLAGQDQITDKQGEDRLRFNGFGVEEVQLASQDESGGLLIEFTDGGSLLVEQHFSGSGHQVEFLETDSCLYRISTDAAFVSGDLADLLSGCILHLSGFEETTAPEPEIYSSCSLSAGVWAPEARDCSAEDCSDGRWKSWDGRTWSHALITQEGEGWNVTVPPGACTFDFWVDWGMWDQNDCGDGVASILIEYCGLTADLTRSGEEQHLTCDVEGADSIEIQQTNVEVCDYVIIGDPIFY
jgi:hypothetical protein